MNYQTVLTSLRSTLAADQKSYSDCVDRTAKLGEEYDKAQKAEKAAAEKMQETKNTILTIESLLQNQESGSGRPSTSTDGSEGESSDTGDEA